MHTLDPLDRRTKRQVFLNGSGTANTTNDYTYDAFGRMTSVSQSGTGVAAKRVNIGYDNLGLVVSESSFNNTSGTGSPVVATTKQYDGLGRTSQIKQMSGANTLVQFDYTYDALGRLASETSNNGSTLATTYTYDAIGQLLAANRSDSVNESYVWDPVGNPVGTGYVIGVNNRLLEDPQFVYSYDDEGNRTGKTPKAGGSATTYNWDYRNRLTGVSGATSSVEKYDAFDRRTISTSGGNSDYYLWDGSHIALEMTSTTAVKTRPLHGPAVDQVFAEEGAGGTRWMLTDIRGSVRGVTNNTGAVQNRITYDSFGAVTNESNPTATDTLFGYTGREFDAGVGMQNNRKRWFDAIARRWASEDPIGFAAGDANVSRYVGNGAVNATDPSGLDYLDIIPLPNGRFEVRYVIEQLWIDTSSHFVGIYDPSTGNVERGGYRVGLELVQIEVGWFHTSNWDRWFKDKGTSCNPPPRALNGNAAGPTSLGEHYGNAGVDWKYLNNAPGAFAKNAANLGANATGYYGANVGGSILIGWLLNSGYRLLLNGSKNGKALFQLVDKSGKNAVNGHYEDIVKFVEKESSGTHLGASAKGYCGIKMTPNQLGPDFAGTPYLKLDLAPGQKNIVKIKLQGSYYGNIKEANKLAGFKGAEAPDGYVWHHLPDYNRLTGEATMQLVKKPAHRATYPHKGSVFQYEQATGKKYN